MRTAGSWWFFRRGQYGLVGMDNVCYHAGVQHEELCWNEFHP